MATNSKSQCVTFCENARDSWQCTVTFYRGSQDVKILPLIFRHYTQPTASVANIPGSPSILQITMTEGPKWYIAKHIESHRNCLLSI